MKIPLLSAMLFTILLFSPALSPAQNAKPLTNQDIIDMVTGGLDEKTITKSIETNPCAFDTTPQTLVQLKKAGIADPILTAMLTAGKPQSSAFPTEIGIYMIRNNIPIELGAEVVNFHSGGVATAILTDGLDKVHTNGQIKGPHSKNQAAAPLDFLIVTSEGASASEYLLLKLDKKSDRREFRQSSAAGRNALDFDVVKLAPRTYRVKLGVLKPGEYGFLMPGAAENRSSQGRGRIYSFTVVE